MPKLSYMMPSFAGYVHSVGILGFKVQERNPEDSCFSITNSQDEEVAIIFLNGSVTLIKREAHDAIIQIATEYEKAYSPKDQIQIICLYEEANLKNT